MIDIDFFNTIKNHFEKNLPFVVFKKPNEHTIQAFMQPNDAVNTSNFFNKKGFVFSPFSLKNKEDSVWFYNAECSVISTVFVPEKCDNNKNVPSNNKGKKEHICRVNNAIDQIQLGKLQKVIISRVAEYKIENTTPIIWFKRCVNLYNSAFSYCWFHPKIGLWLGATPETLISAEKNKFSTMALAGTLPFQGKLNVQWRKKEIEEQQMVVNSIISELQKVAINIKKSDTETQKAGSLLHLKTEIEGEVMDKNNFTSILKVLHPTSAVCGLPKERSRNYILEHEGYNRKYYTGFLGEFNAEQKTTLFVNLRCMEIEKNVAKIYVGGGITGESIALNEWEETVNKSMTMKNIL